LTDNKDHLTAANIQDLEKKYMEKIWQITAGKEFLDNVKFIEKYLKEKWSVISRNYDDHNFYNVIFENVVKYHIPKKLAKVPYPNPLQSDLAFYPEEEDCILMIDAKVVNINPKANVVDKDDLIVGEDQVTVSINRQKSDDNIKNSGYNFSGITFKSTLDYCDYHYSFKHKVPILTYFLKCLYNADLSSKKFQLDKIVLTNVPNIKVYETEWPEENVVQTVKFYKYFDSTPYFMNLSKIKQKKYYPIKAQKFKKNDKIEFDWSLNNSKRKLYLDKKLKDPFNQNLSLAWTQIRGSKGKPGDYKLIYGIHGIRLNKKIDRNSSTGKWKGLIEKNLSSSS